MDHSLANITSFFSGTFHTTPADIKEKLKGIRAFVYDWDGVFNDGSKDENGASPFNEIDSMGTNMLRFNHYLLHNALPYFAILSGEKNSACFKLAKREHFDAVYFRVKHKAAAIDDMCEKHKLVPHQIAFVFDDVPDLSVAKIAGLRIMIPHSSTLLLINYATEHGLVDYVTSNSGSHNAVRESTELMMGLSGRYNETIEARVSNSEKYKQYLSQRQGIQTSFFTVDNTVFTEQKDL